MRGKDILFNDTYTVKNTDTIMSLKLSIQMAHGFFYGLQRIHCNASLMEDNKTFEFYGIQDGERLYDILVA